MRHVILYRGREFEEEEYMAARSAGFVCMNSRMYIDEGDLVIPRYSSLPFHKELEADVTIAGARLINSFAQHQYVADMQNWYSDLERLTPETWFRVSDVPFQKGGPFVLKGCTNSKKFLFDTHMFCQNRADLGTILGRLLDDGLIGQQSIYVREFEQFKTYKVGLHGLPVTAEFRFFILNSQVITGGYYWASHIEELREMGISEHELSAERVPTSFLEEIIARVGNKIPFFVVDVAQREDGRWRVVELNDGCMSGPSCIDPAILYKVMKGILDVNLRGQGQESSD